MKRIAKTALFAALAAALLSSVPVPSALAAGPGSKAVTKGTARAEAELAALGVPLQKDPDGNVRWIEAREGELTDQAIGMLPLLPRLEWLEIGNGVITPGGMRHLANCTSLKRLYVYDVLLKGDALPWLSGLAGLEALSLQRTGIDGKFLRNLKAEGTLKVLNLSGNAIGDADIDGITRFENLEVLALADTGVTGDGVRKLEGMQRLNELNLSRCTLHDYDLTAFLSMPNLRIVYAEGCDISDMAIGNVVARFPMLAIFR